jgi:hypothetical protein
MTKGSGNKFVADWSFDQICITRLKLSHI